MFEERKRWSLFQWIMCNLIKVRNNSSDAIEVPLYKNYGAIYYASNYCTIWEYVNYITATQMNCFSLYMKIEVRYETT